MPLAELQRRLGLTDHMAGVHSSSNGLAVEEQTVKAEAADHMVANGGLQQPADIAAAGLEAAGAQAADGAAATDAVPNGDAAAAAAAAGEAALRAVEAEPGPTAAEADEEADVSVAPVYDLYEALLRVLLQVHYGSAPFMCGQDLLLRQQTSMTTTQLLCRYVLL